jgi:SAM-dependent methyltransferase
MAWFHGSGHPVTGVDRDLASAKAVQCPGTLVAADIEGDPWPLLTSSRPTHFGAVVVTNYLWRPLLPTILQSVAPGGVLLYETFAAGNETVGRPSRADFLLAPGELLEVCSGWHVVAYECGTLQTPPRFVQRIAASKPLPGSDTGCARIDRPL